MIKGVLAVLVALGAGWVYSLWRRWSGAVCPECGTPCAHCSVKMPKWDRHDLTAHHGEWRPPWVVT